MHLLAWYDVNRRDLPWRRTHDPYAIWVSEIMLQQTRVAVVEERFERFIARFPNIVELALATDEEVLGQWSGLGYYRRARMLHKAARFVALHGQGSLPKTAEELRALPGIGAYTAAAVASIAHGEAVAVVDGNVERVLCRLAGLSAAGRNGVAALRRNIEQLATQMLDREHPGDFNQAMMELGATVCVPRKPQCQICPVAAVCATKGEHKTTPRPRMLSREVGHALSVREAKGGREILLEQRLATQTVMPGLWQLPVLRESDVPPEELRMTVRHAIMQVNYYVRIRNVDEQDVAGLTVDDGARRWVPLPELAGMALTGLARKVLSRAQLLSPAESQALRGSALKGGRAIG